MTGPARGIAVVAALWALQSFAPAAAADNPPPPSCDPPAECPQPPPPECGTPTGCPPPEPVREVLSTPGHVSRWAFVLKRAVARAQPDTHSKAITRLRLTTQDGTDELVMALERVTTSDHRRWVRVRLPILPNGATGWVPQEALGGFHRVRTWLKVDLAGLHATLVRSGRVVFRARIGVGRKRWPTPHGEFFVRDRLEGFPPGGIYGPLAFGLNARSAVLTDWPGGGFVGIHGTNEPYLLPGRVSHGCIRMSNRDILRLGRLLPIGTPVTLR